MCIHPTLVVSATQQQFGNPCPAKLLGPKARQELALEALAGTQSISQLAQEHEVSRKFVYQQADKAELAIEQAFDPAPAADDDQVLFNLPVTKPWLRGFVLGLLLICRSSYRGVGELLRDHFDYPISEGQVHYIAQAAMEQARSLNQQIYLSAVRIGAHDEIFHVRQPVLVGIDVASTYCYLLSLEEHRDGETWAIRLLELRDRGFQPEAIICDGGTGLQAGQELALPTTPRRGDVFHAFQETQVLVSFLENRAYETIAVRSKLERKQAGKKKQGRGDAGLAQKLRHARPAEVQAISLADNVATLVQWLRQDILALAGPSYAERRALYDFVVAELRARQPLCPHRIGPLVTYLVNHRDALLAFAKQLDADLESLANEFQVPVAVVRALFQVQALDPRDSRRWPQEAALRQQLRGRFHDLSQATAALAESTVRASSVVENLNSRLRNYFFLRRHLGPDYLHLLQFFLNHRRFLRSEHPERVDKSPTELLTGQKHPHWLEMLGLAKPSRN